MKSLHDLVLLAALTTLPAVAQQRVYPGGTPTILNADWGMIVAAPDELPFGVFVAFLPLSALPAWAACDSDSGGRQHATLLADICAAIVAASTNGVRIMACIAVLLA